MPPNPGNSLKPLDDPGRRWQLDVFNPFSVTIDVTATASHSLGFEGTSTFSHVRHNATTCALNWLTLPSHHRPFLVTNGSGSRESGASERQALHEWLNQLKTYVKIDISFSFR